MHLGSPYKKGEEEYSKCEMYKVLLLVNYNHNPMSLIDCEWKENVAKSRSDCTDVREEYTIYMLVIAFDDHDKKENMDESKNPGWKLDSCPGGEWQRMAKGSRPHLERNAVSSWLELWQVPGIEELARNLDLKRINAGLSMPTHWSQNLT